MRGGPPEFQANAPSPVMPTSFSPRTVFFGERFTDVRVPGVCFPRAFRGLPDAARR